MADSLKLSPDEINNDTTPMTIKSWDSIGHLNMLIALEKGFKIEFSDDEAVEMISYPSILNIIKGKVK